MATKTNPTTQEVLTPAEFREQLIANGMTLKQWAENNGFDTHYCTRVLGGSIKGQYGMGHTIAVAMGIKAKPKNSEAA